MVAVPGLVRQRTIVRRVAAEKSANAGTASDEKRQQEAGSKEGAGDARARRNLLDRDGWQGERARENGKLEESEESSPPGTARALHRVPFGTVPFLGSPDRDAHGERSLARLPGQGAVAPNVHPDARYRGAPGSTRVSIETAGRRVLAPVLRGDSPLRRGSETGPEGRRRLGCFPEKQEKHEDGRGCRVGRPTSENFIRLFLTWGVRAFMHLPAELAVHPERYPTRGPESPAVGG